MAKILNTIFILTITGWLCFFPNLFPNSAIAGNTVKTTVRVIHASQGQNHIDPELKDLAKELGSVFKYTFYKLINTKNMNLGNNQKGLVKIPGNRSLVVTPINIGREKIKYQIGIFKSGDQIFKTQILLNNQRSITIGGPKFKNGYLLFNISGKIL